MSKQKITTTSLKAFNSNASINQRMTDTELLGFYVKQRKNGPFFYLDYSALAGKRTLSIGNFPTITAEQAPNLVKQYLGRIASGADVRQTIEEEKTPIKEARLLTVKSYLEDIYKISLNLQKSGTHTRQALEKHLVSWMDKKINNIDARDVHKWQVEMESKELGKFSFPFRFYTYRY
ncbi:MAG: Arm DNA-binding domain-containing protein [Gammaproteobacteria bacterium]|nr:Arm DNA-binding domain-containing protein [Gammaproteobacteria bacterium]